MTIRNSMRLSAAALLFTFHMADSQAATAVPDWNMSGISDAGFPHFEDSVKVNFFQSKSNWILTATNTSGTHRFQHDASTAYDVSKPSFTLTATFDGNLNFTGGNVQIKGKVSGMGMGTTTTLWKGSLTNFGTDTNSTDGSPTALGFATSGHSGWATQFSSGAPESVYLFGSKLSTLALNLSNHRGVSVSGLNATALTTVPVPGAVWLLGSGLMALLGMRVRSATSGALAA